MSAEPPALPRAHDDDEDDVAWALQTAQVQWERGGTADAIVWLKRAAESAAEAGKYPRSADIQRRANEIDRWLKNRVSFPVQQDDDDDGVDELLAGDQPEIEAGTLSEPSPSLVDALEAEADDYRASGAEEAPVDDLGDLEDVEDIEAVDLDEFEEERKLEGYHEELLDETTHARSEVSRALLSSELPTAERPASSRAPASRRPEQVQAQPPSSRPYKPPERTVVSAPPPKPARASTRPASTRPPSTRPASSSRGGSPAWRGGPSRASQRTRSAAPQTGSTIPGTGSTAPSPERRSRNATPQVPPPVEYKLPPPPIPRLPLPPPRVSSPPSGLPEVSEPRSTFPSEPATQPASERPVLPLIAEAPRQRIESLPELSVTEVEMPEQEAPTSTYTLGSADEGTTAARRDLHPRASSAPQRGGPREPPVSSAAPAELDAAVNALSETPPPPPVLDVALLAACRGLEDLPPETQEELARRARVETLAPDQEVSNFGLALVTRGHVVVMPTIAEGASGYAARGEPVFSRGTLSEGVPLRAVALAEGAEVAVWRPEDFEHVLATCPWVADELRAVADRFQALAGAAMGPLGDRLDDNMRAMLTDRCELRVMLTGEVLIEEGKVPGGLYIVGGGKLEVVSGGKLVQELGPGDMPFASSLLTRAKATASVRAAAGGALVLFADRMVTHELIVSVPPLLELLSTV